MDKSEELFLGTWRTSGGCSRERRCCLDVGSLVVNFPTFSWTESKSSLSSWLSSFPKISLRNSGVWSSEATKNPGVVISKDLGIPPILSSSQYVCMVPFPYLPMNNKYQKSLLQFSGISFTWHKMSILCIMPVQLHFVSTSYLYIHNSPVLQDVPTNLVQ